MIWVIPKMHSKILLTQYKLNFYACKSSLLITQASVQLLVMLKNYHITNKSNHRTLHQKIVSSVDTNNLTGEISDFKT